MLNNTEGAQTFSEPEFEYIREIYCVRDLFELHESIDDLIAAIKIDSTLISEIIPRQFFAAARWQLDTAFNKCIFLKRAYE